MGSYLDFDEQVDVKNFNYSDYLFSLSDKERERIIEARRAAGFLKPVDDGFFGELSDRAADSFTGGMEGFGATLNELGFGAGVQDYFSRIRQRNRQWQQPESVGVMGKIGGAIGSALGSTAVTLGASVAGSAVAGPAGGLAAGVGAAMMQSFGGNVQRNREAGYSEGKAYGMAFLESGVDSLIENAPLGIVGKGLSKETRKQLLSLVGKKISDKVGKKNAQQILANLGKEAALAGGGEALEEGLQYVNTYVNQKLGGDPNAHFSVNELSGVMSDAFIGAFFIGGVKSAPGVISEGRNMAENAPVAPEAQGGVVNMENIAPASAPTENALFDTLITDVGNALGINIDFMDSRPDGAELEAKNNGIYDKNNKTLYLNRNTYSVNPAETLGHELKHYIDDNIPELSKAFNTLLEAGKNEAGKQEVAEIAREFGITEAEGNVEFSADIFGKLFARPETWQKVSEKLDEKTPGMGEKFLQTLRDFYVLVKNTLEKYVGKNPEAETFLNNVNELQEEASRMLAELQKRKKSADSMPKEIDGLIKKNKDGSTRLPEFVPVDQINLDPERFQFKENKDKSGVVNKLEGTFNQEQARPLFLWEDKQGKRYVVEGHHRLDLARRSGTKDILAYIHKESEGETAEDARKRGVLMNIHDNKGSVRDFAEFFRGDDITYDEAKKQGLFRKNEPEPEQGFIIGKYAGDTLYSAFRNDDINAEKAAVIADAARGDEGLETAGLKKAPSMGKEHLAEYMKLLKKLPRERDEQGDLFGFDDSAIIEADKVSALALKHQKKLREMINSGKGAIKRPNAAKGVGVSGSKNSAKLLEEAQKELARYEHYETDHELYQQLLEEAGLKKKEDVSETEKTTPAPEVKEEVVSAENAQTTPAEDDADGLFDTQEETVSKKESVEPVVKENLTTETAATAEKSSEVKPEESEVEKSAFKNLKDRSAELGFSFDEFYKKFKPSLNAILAKARRRFSETLGNDIEAEWGSAADETLVKAYMKYPATGGKAELKTYASKAVVNAINSVNRKHKAETTARSGRVSLDQTNEQGEALSEVVADENQAKESDTVSARENPQEAIRRISESKKLSPVQKQIVDLLNQDFSPSVVMRKLGMRFGEEGNRRFMSPDEFQLQMAAIRTIAEEEGVLYSRKRGAEENGSLRNGTEENEIIIEAKNPQYEMPSPFDPKNLKKWLKEFYKHKEKPINKNTGWKISVPGTGIEETLNHLYRNRKNYRDDLHYLSLPYIDKMLEKAKFEKFDDVENGKNADAISIFNVILNFGEQGKYNARMVIKHFGEDKNFYDHKLTEFEELSDLELQSEDSGSLNNSSTPLNIPQSGEKSSADLEFSRKRLHQQINPVVRDGIVRDEYADLLANKEYTPETLEKWSNEALEWILKQGGIRPAAEKFINDNAPAERHVATLARRMIINSDVYANDFSFEERVKLNEQEIDDRSSWGKQGRAMQLAALKLDDIASVQALLNKLHEKMPPEDLKKLRNSIKDKIGVDIYHLPDDIVNDKQKLDTLLREELAHKANFKDKLYEYWINAILSGPATHMKNLYGNTANAAYELGIKRFVEAVVNTIAQKKDGATFGEFREMVKAFNWSNAWDAAKQSFQLEVLDNDGKFNEKRNIAIGGKTGRFIRIPGRALKAADALAKAIIQPMETAAYAYRLGVSEGMTGERLQMFIQKQLTTPNSKAYQWGMKRGKELTFQEDSPQFLNTLMALRESDGFMGHALKIFLPFIKTPYNILKQGVRKSPLGAVSLAVDTFQRLKDKKGFDGEYVSRLAEQLLAWGAVMAVYGLSDDDDELPMITGASAKYGSAEYGFKANKLPPFSIRIFGNWVSYAGVEPFATSLAAIADSVKTFNNARNGKSGTIAMKEMLNSVGQIITEKSFIDSIAEIVRVVQDPEREIHKPVSNTVALLVPNFYRQARNAFIDNVPDNKSREKGLEFIKDQFIVVTNKMGVTTAVPKVDYFGREVKKDSFENVLLSPVGRLLAIRAFDADDNMDKAEKLIWDYNRKNPDAPWYPDLPAAAFKINGKKVYLAGEDYQNYAIDAGVLAHKQINNAIRAGKINLRNPDEKDINLVKQIFSRARKETKQKYLRKAKEF